MDGLLIPEALLPYSECRQWVAWRWETREGKRIKPPRNPATGGYASITAAASWGTLSAARKAVERYRLEGIGLVVTPDDPLCGVDLDGCVSGDGTVHPTAWGAIRRLDSYTERTPSGTGLRVWLRGTIPGRGRKKTCWRGIKAIEIYDRDRYFTVTGLHLDGTAKTVESRQSELEALLVDLFAIERDAVTGSSPATSSADLSDLDLLGRARHARSGEAFWQLWNGDTTAYDGDHSRADLALCGRLAFWTGGDAERIDRFFRLSGLMREKWNRADYRERTIAAALGNRTQFYRPRLSTTGPTLDRDSSRTAAASEIRFLTADPAPAIHSTPNQANQS